MSKVKLGDVAREHKETLKTDKSEMAIVGLEHLIPGYIRLVNWDTNKENTFTKAFRKGNMLFGRRRAYLKKAAYAEIDGICSGDITVIEAIPGKISPLLLPFIIQNDQLFDYAVGKSAGSLSPRVKWEDLKEFEFELPETMSEQEKIAEVLWSMVDTSDKYKNLMQKTDELVKSQFVEMFDQGNWQTIKFSDAYTLQMGKTPSRAQMKYWSANDYRWISIADLSSYGKYTGDTKEYISQTAVDETGIKVTPKGTVIMSFKLTIGIAAITSEDIYTNEAIMAFIPRQSDISTDFLRYYLSVKDWSDEGKQAVKGTTLNKNSIGNATIIVPPAELQEQFVIFANQSDKSKFKLEKCLQELEKTYKKILKENLEKKED